MVREEPRNIEAEISVLGCGFLDNKDALEKMEKLPKEILENSRFHLIGHLQSNKVKKMRICEAKPHFFTSLSFLHRHLAGC